MTRFRIRVVCAAAGLLVSMQSLGAQTPTPQANPKSKEEKMQNAMSAAPEAIAKEATILDYPEKEGGEMAALCQGTNRWTCLPDDPSTPANNPMCLDQMAMV